MTPLARLDGQAARLGLGNLCVKDESYRFGLNAFKVLGGAYAVARVLGARLGIPERGCHSRRSHGQGGQGRCHNKFFHNLPPPYNTGYLLP